ncbi:MAG: hypothetical protein ACOY3I_04485 [Verrucomicrobiota bacterium]
MSTTKIIKEFKSLPTFRREKALQAVLSALYSKSKKVIKRLWRRIENPEIPEDVWEGIEDAEAFFSCR